MTVKERHHRQGDRARQRRHGRRHDGRHLHLVAEPLDALHRQAVRGARHRRGRRRARDHQDEPFPHAQAADHRRLPDLRGQGPDLRRRHAGDALVQQAGREQEGRGAGAGADQLQAGRRRLVLERRPGAPLPPAQLLAAEHQAELHRPPRRRADLVGRVHHAHAAPELEDRPLAHPRREHERPPHGRLQRGQAHRDVAHQHRPARPRHAQRHLPLHREGQPAAHGRRRLRPPGAVLGAVHLERRLRPRGVLVGRARRGTPTSATAASTSVPATRPSTTRGPSPATRSRSPAAPSPARGTTATPSGSSAGRSCGRAAPRTWRCA